MIRCLIVDDEVIAQQILEQYIASTPGLTLVAVCRNALEAFAKLEQHKIDLIFLDIEMPLVNGLSFLKSLSVPPKIIFTTAYGEHALEGFNLGVTDYLLKPFSLQRFQQAIRKVEEVLKPEATVTDNIASHLILKEKNNGNCKIEFSKIIYIEASKDYMNIVTAEEKYTALITMTKLEALLPATKFVRTHKSFIVAVPMIKFLRNDHLVLSDGSFISVSAGYKERVQELFSKTSLT